MCVQICGGGAAVITQTLGARTQTPPPRFPLKKQHLPARKVPGRVAGGRARRGERWSCLVLPRRALKGATQCLRREQQPQVSF